MPEVSNFEKIIVFLYEKFLERVLEIILDKNLDLVVVTHVGDA